FFKSLSVEVKALTKEDLELTEIREGDGPSIHRLRLPGRFGSGPMYFYMPDRRSVVFSGIAPSGERAAKGPDAFRRMLTNVAAARQRDWGTGVDKVMRAPIALVLDNRDQNLAQVFAKDVTPEQLRILQDIRFAALGIELGEGRPVRLVLDARSTE